MIVHREIKNTRQDANPTTPIIGSLMKQLSVAFVACLLALFLVMPSVHAGTITIKHQPLTLYFTMPRRFQEAI